MSYLRSHRSDDFTAIWKLLLLYGSTGIMEALTEKLRLFHLQLKRALHSPRSSGMDAMPLEGY